LRNLRVVPGSLGSASARWIVDLSCSGLSRRNITHTRSTNGGFGFHTQRCKVSGGTFTVSNLGMYGISNFHAVINTPQAGILAVGELKPKPVVTDSGEIEARQLMGVTLACDHRILYGADGAVFLARVRELLESPLGLAL